MVTMDLPPRLRLLCCESIGVLPGCVIGALDPREFGVQVIPDAETELWRCQ
jgi:hypothetical protein